MSKARRRWAPLLVVVSLASLACGSQPVPSPLMVQETDGAYTLSFTISKRTWRPGEPVQGQVSFAISDGGQAAVSGSGENFVGFEFARDGGPTITPAWPASCRTHVIDPIRPLVFPIQKSGQVDPSNPNAHLLRKWLTDPLVQLPAGRWRITAIAVFHDAEECAGAERTVRLPLDIEVVE